MKFSFAQQRYNRAVLRLSIAYALLLLAAVWLFVHHAITGPVAYVVGILPGLPITAMFVMMGRYLVEETDEYLRMLQVRQLLIATGITMSMAIIWGFLEGFELAPHVMAYWWPTIFFAGHGVGALANYLIERRPA